MMCHCEHVYFTSDYVDRLLDEVLIRRNEMPSYRECLMDLTPVFATIPEPVSAKFGAVDKEATIERHQSRFNH